MPTSTSPDQTSPVTLRIETGNPAAEVFLLDPQLQLVARGVGSLVTRQIPGVYKIRVRLGRESTTQLILLSGDTTESINAPLFASPAPLGTTTLTHEYHIAAAETHSAQPTVVLGEGASIFVLARYFTPPEQQARRQHHPGRDLALRHIDGTLLVDLGSASITGGPPDAWAACHVQLAPGAYVLECQTAQGPLAHSIIASPGWQTQVFLIRPQTQSVADTDSAGGTIATGVFDMGTVLMSSGTFRSTSADLLLTELARIALADERPILGGPLRDLLMQKFSNPMQGIFGAHLMLLARDRSIVRPRQFDTGGRTVVPDPEQPFDPQLFDMVVSNLRGLVGTTHPDVEALSLQCSNPAYRTKDVFTVPPMLRRSWSLIVEASNDHPEILDAMLWERVMTRTMTAPFLSWLVVSDDARADFHESMREVVESRRMMRDPEPRSPAASVDEPLSGLAPESAASSQAVSPTGDFRRRLSRDLEMPRSAIDRMLGRQ
jgi:hypothetical protein